MICDPLRRRLYEEPLDPEELERRLRLALSEEEEIAAAAALCARFMRRYPTAGSTRLRAANAEWMRSAPGHRDPQSLG
jgi:hypothetical protein